MKQNQLKGIVHQLRRLAGGATETAPTDQQLLEEFARSRDGSALATLVERHGPLVWRVSRRAMGNNHDAEDVFQAAFLVLLRQAGNVRWRASIAGWLYEVAVRLARSARRQRQRRRLHEQRAGAEKPAWIPEFAQRELDTLVDDELLNLPEIYRNPLVLCYLEGLTGSRAAKQLGWSLRTLERRLARGRELLRIRLTRRGIRYSAALMAPALAHKPPLPSTLVPAVLRAVAAFSVGMPGEPADSMVLAQHFLKGLAMGKSKVWGAMLLAAVVLVGSGILVHRPLAAKDATPSDASLQTGPGSAKSPEADRTAPVSDLPQAVSDVIAQRAWKIMETVANQHFEPCPLKVMVEAGVRALCKAGGSIPPANLSECAAQATTLDRYFTLVREAWPTTAKEGLRAKLEEALLDGILSVVPGRPHLAPVPTAKEVKVQEQTSNNRYVGIGIQLSMHNEEKRAQIVTAFRRGAAHRAGVRAGDLIVQLDAKDTAGVPLAQVVDWIRGEEGTFVTVKVRQPGSNETRTYRMKRGVVPFEHVFGWRNLGDTGWNYRADPMAPIAYVRIGGVVSSTLHELRQAERRLRAQGFQAIVLDLRFCSGGSMDHLALVADGLLDGGLLWSVAGAHDAARMEFHADRECVFRDWPMVVLVNKSLERGPALIAAALQDNSRAVLVGEVTRNDGYMSSAIPLPGEKLLLVLPTGRIERADKARGWPLKPDHVVADDAYLQKRAEWFRKQEMAQDGSNEKAPPDPQLAKAVEILRTRLAERNGATVPKLKSGDAHR